MEWENSIMWVCTLLIYIFVVYPQAKQNENFIYILDFSILRTTCLDFSSKLAKSQKPKPTLNEDKKRPKAWEKAGQKQQQEM